MACRSLSTACVSNTKGKCTLQTLKCMTHTKGYSYWFPSIVLDSSLMLKSKYLFPLVVVVGTLFPLDTTSGRWLLLSKQKCIISGRGIMLWSSYNAVVLKIYGHLG